MKKAHYWLTLLAFLGASLVAASAVAQQDYATFKTNDEENNIEVFKQASPSVVYITNSRLVRRSFYSLNPQEIPQGSGSGFIPRPSTPARWSICCSALAQLRWRRTVESQA